MSRGDLQEMEVGTKQSKTAVNANAKAADAMPHLSGNIPLDKLQDGKILADQILQTIVQMMIQRN